VGPVRVTSAERNGDAGAVSAAGAGAVWAVREWLSKAVPDLIPAGNEGGAINLMRWVYACAGLAGGHGCGGA